jgi:hypothetical protein
MGVGVTVGTRNEQINQTCPANVGSNELGGELDSIEKKGKIARRRSTKTNLLGKDVAEKQGGIRLDSLRWISETYRVRVRISVLGG